MFLNNKDVEMIYIDPQKYTQMNKAMHLLSIIVATVGLVQQLAILTITITSIFKLYHVICTQLCITHIHVIQSFRSSC